MPRKRRHPKRRSPLPQGLAQISGCERAYWGVYGPEIASEHRAQDIHAETGMVLYHVWPSWDVFMRFYAAVRQEWCAERPWIRERSAVERLYGGWIAGADLDELQADIAEDVMRNDPRPFLRQEAPLAS